MKDPIFISRSSLPYRGPGAVLPALQQTVPVAGLPGLGFGEVGAGSALHAVTLLLGQAVADALDIQHAVARPTLTGAFALSSHMPPVETGPGLLGLGQELPLGQSWPRQAQARAPPDTEQMYSIYVV